MPVKAMRALIRAHFIFRQFPLLARRAISEPPRLRFPDTFMGTRAGNRMRRGNCAGEQIECR